MKRYTQQAAVPPNLMVKSRLAQFGLKLSRGQKPVAIFTGPTGPHMLYDRAQATPIRQRRQPSS